MEKRYVCILCHGFHPENNGVTEPGVCKEPNCKETGKPLTEVSYCESCNYVYPTDKEHNHEEGFQFHFHHNAANSSAPVDTEVDRGTHFTIEIMLKHKGKFVMVRRPKGHPGHQRSPKAKDHPNGCLYFCHDLARWGDTVEKAVNRILKSQLGLVPSSSKVIDLTMHTYPDELHTESNKQWAITLFIEAELENLPQTNELVTEVVEFDTNNIPNDMGWWEVDELREFVGKHKV